jgi:hypothetical protein
MTWSHVGAFDPEVSHAMARAIKQISKGGTTPTFTANYFELYEHPDRDKAAADLAVVAAEICSVFKLSRELLHGI